VKKPEKTPVVVDGECAGPEVCPLSQVKAGTLVCVRQLAASPDVTSRLREMGLGEDQHVRLVSQDSNVICQVCNARVALSYELAAAIFVEPLPSGLRKA
jgi:Fe2+ transport system protein FeoA